MVRELRPRGARAGDSISLGGGRTAAGRGAGALSDCCPARVRGGGAVGSARGSPGLIPPAEATAGRAVPGPVTRPDPAPGSRSPRTAGQGEGEEWGGGGREGVVGEGLWGPQGRVPGLSALL